MYKTFKRTILIDLDGVLNEYNGKFDENTIPPIKKGAKPFLEALSKDFEIKLFTTRNKILATKWLVANKIDGLFADITKEDLHISFFICRIVCGVISQKEHQNLCWITKEKLSDYTFCPADTEIVEMLKNDCE